MVMAKWTFRAMPSKKVRMGGEIHSWRLWCTSKLPLDLTSHWHIKSSITLHFCLYNSHLKNLHGQNTMLKGVIFPYQKYVLKSKQQSLFSSNIQSAHYFLQIIFIQMSFASTVIFCKPFMSASVFWLNLFESWKPSYCWCLNLVWPTCELTNWYICLSNRALEGFSAHLENWLYGTHLKFSPSILCLRSWHTILNKLACLTPDLRSHDFWWVSGKVNRSLSLNLPLQKREKNLQHFTPGQNPSEMNRHFWDELAAIDRNKCFLTDNCCKAIADMIM